MTTGQEDVSRCVLVLLPFWNSLGLFLLRKLRIMDVFSSCLRQRVINFYLSLFNRVIFIVNRFESDISYFLNIKDIYESIKILGTKSHNCYYFRNVDFLFYLITAYLAYPYKNARVNCY